MAKYKYTQKTVSRNKQGQGMNLLSLLFFMMGAVNVYGHLQGSDNQVTPSNNNDMTSLLKVGIFTMLLAAILELFVI
ncbi:hypothetical protein cce_0848 [Crocosphaera subtropica ATCC 51142]|uniref:Uncharacterized protein n=1 Tax=Crocosphaera subtropica (strain ATCC 51142 / BH68) TaxID=43989 RepID=B1WS05_CROS5|nr:hypothetical protein [Crocosphaera subtropica]ACB50199.1 hypothetical protein cce_0848 [Crocosphaera subtropica ATCC 51142]